MHDLTLTPEIRAACAARFNADFAALQRLAAAQDPPLRVQRRGNEVTVGLGSVRTAFRDGSEGPVVAAVLNVEVEMLPTTSFLYPFTPPDVRVRMEPPAGLKPFLPGLHWVDGFDRTLIALFDRLAGRMPGQEAEGQYGIPCLFRTWRPRYDFSFLLLQVWDALRVGGGSSSVGDAMDEAAARYFAERQALAVPLADPLVRVEEDDDPTPPPASGFRFLSVTEGDER